MDKKNKRINVIFCRRRKFMMIHTRMNGFHVLRNWRTFLWSDSLPLCCSSATCLHSLAHNFIFIYFYRRLNKQEKCVRMEDFENHRRRQTREKLLKKPNRKHMKHASCGRRRKKQLVNWLKSVIYVSIDTHIVFGCLS
jgi:hypothetical protein